MAVEPAAHGRGPWEELSLAVAAFDDYRKLEEARPRWPILDEDCLLLIQEQEQP